MIVRKSNFEEVIDILSYTGIYSLDTETTGLNSYLGDRLFSIILADSKDAYYFNFQNYHGVDPDYVLDRALLPALQKALDNPQSLFYLHNAKFDLSMLVREGLHIAGIIHDTEVMARLVCNNHMSYSLSECAKRIGLNKSDAVDDYITANDLYSIKKVPGKKKTIKVPHYDRVPFEIIVPYGLQDARVTFELGEYQRKMIREKSSSTSASLCNLNNLYANDCKLTKVCFSMEQMGIQVDIDFCARAFEYETKLATLATHTFKEITGVDYVDSAKTFRIIFDSLGLKYGVTEKGNPSFKDEELEKLDHPIVDIIRQHRGSSKKANTYYRNFLEMSDEDGVLHANIRMGGTDTGRFSMSEPNLQNLSRPEEGDEVSEFEIRRAFVPRPGFCFVMIDYDQMEYRMLLNYANETKLIEKVLAGLDVHQATADQMGVTRTKAKTLNFMLLYGGGTAKLAKSLGVSHAEAAVLKDRYFKALPNVQDFINTVIFATKRRGYVRNWTGYTCYFDSPDFAYKSPNYLIQGGCAQVIRFALVFMHDFLSDKKSRLLVSIHDEALLEIHETELHIVPELVKIMEGAFRPTNIKLQLPFTCGPSYSWKSWADKVKGYPPCREGTCL